MPCRPDRRVCIELANHICGMFLREGVPCAHVREIIQDPHLSYIWNTLPHDMVTLMCHVVGALILIRRLRASTQSRSSLEDKVPGDTHHDSP